MKKNKQVIAVLGASGFAGDHICESLLEKGYTVHAYSQAKPKVLKNHRDYTFFELDVNNAHSLEGALQYDCIVNATGFVGGVGYNAKNHQQMETSNFLLMKSAADLAYEQARYFIQISSACVYANEVSEGAREDEGFIGLPDAANHGYGVGKRKGEEYTKLLFAGQSHACTIVRPYNLYGPGDDFSDKAHVIPALINKLLFDEDVHVWGNGDQVREFVFVKDFAECIASIVEKQPKGILNISGGKDQAISIRELVTMLESIIQSGKKISFDTGGLSGQLVKYGDNGKMRQFDLQLKTQLVDGLRETILWRLEELKEQPQKIDHLPEIFVDKRHVLGEKMIKS
ncbi:MAG: NAD-dependent epimerase/dehydratase [Deferribacteres bacterium]|nr:NAD-dependent epimerase/dehydratase [candidate division KSB1 bacterium]MCB9501970.1 NAD-dependent epimerase/dehydratase [Deferribacteres bacterium]